MRRAVRAAADLLLLLADHRDVTALPAYLECAFVAIEHVAVIMPLELIVRPQPHLIDQVAVVILVDHRLRVRRLMVVGVCMQSDTIEPLMAISKEMDVHFVYGYSGEEFGQTLVDLADGKLDAAPIITSVVRPEGVAQAFETLSKPEDEAKIMIKFD